MLFIIEWSKGNVQSTPLPLDIGLLQMKSNHTSPKIMHGHILFQQQEQKNYRVWD